jgi:Undecaprenyl-phosphate glucose phosphotransferase
LHLLDVPVLYGAFVVAYKIRFETTWLPPSGLAAPPLAEYQLTFVLMALGWTAFLWGSGTYDRIRFGFGSALRLGGHLAIAGGFSLAVFFFRRDFSYSRLTILLSFVIAYIGLVIFHLVKAWILMALIRRGWGKVPAVVVGPRDLALECLGRLAAGGDDLGLRLLGYLGDAQLEAAEAEDLMEQSAARLAADGAMARAYLHSGSPDTPGPDLEALEERFPRLGEVDAIAEVVAREGVQELFVAHPLTAGRRTVEVLRVCEDTTAAVRLVPDVLGIITHGVRMRLVGGLAVLDVGRSSMQGVDGWLKRCMDVLGSGLGLILISPLLTRSDSPGPILYKQERVGMDGRPFTILKFRSMPVDAEAQTGPIWATKGDPRATEWGSFMRKWSLDELPQLWNVLVGDMSLVGPRPERPHFVDRFRQDIPGYMQRHRVKAGITGWAQINGLRGECPIEERTRYDIWYIENWSLMLDVEILLRTLWLVAFHPDG